jgi:hypothetical protein
MATGKCDNCGQVIGHLEESYSYYTYIVCKTCKAKLDSPFQSPGTAEDNVETEVSVADVPIEQDSNAEYQESAPEKSTSQESKQRIETEADQSVEASSAAQDIAHEISPSVDETRQPKAEEIKTKTGGRFFNAVGWVLLFTGWMLLAVSCIALVGILAQPRYRDSTIESLLTQPDGIALARTVGLMVGVNIPPILACLFGLYVSARRNPRGKALILASVLVFLVNAACLFLPSSKSTATDGDGPVSPTPSRSESVVERRG